jgi:hypothetical protein
MGAAAAAIAGHRRLEAVGFVSAQLPRIRRRMHGNQTDEQSSEKHNGFHRHILVNKCCWQPAYYAFVPSAAM